MTNHFTTPEFADLLKRFGIEIDTPFYWQPEKGTEHEGYYLCAKDGFTYGLTCALFFIEAKITTEIVPAYPAYLLTQVLGWLPENIGENKWGFSWILGKDMSIQYLDLVSTKPLYYADSIEQLITQGLTEGWLTKQIIEQAIKDNA